MRKIHITSASYELLEGFIAGIEYANDSAIQVESFDLQERSLQLVDFDGEDGDDRDYELTSEGLE